MEFRLIASKCGMTRVYREDGTCLAVTVLSVLPHRVVRRKTKDRDGYAAVQFTTGSVKPSRLTRPAAGTYAVHGVEAGWGLWEMRLDSDDDMPELNPGAEFGLDVLKGGMRVDVRGLTIGKGFAGVVKRHHFRTQDATHGNSLSHRAPGSIGQNQSPGKVFKGKKMAGRLGGKLRTVQNLRVLDVDTQRSVLLVSGAVPGPVGSRVSVTPAAKMR